MVDIVLLCNMSFRYSNNNILRLVCAIQFFIGLCVAGKAPDFSFIYEATSAPNVSFYDYIVVGGGTAGCPLAATLSQGSRVLVLERGGSPYSQPNKDDIDNFVNNVLDSSPTSFSQQFTSGDGVYNTRARVLGGGTVLNAGFYSRAEPGFVEQAGWNKTLVMESYEWVEKAVVFQPPVLQWQSAVRAGLLEAGVLPDNGFTYDHVDGTKIGGTILDKDGHRHTAADLLQYADPSTISVYLRATVQKILFKYNQGTKRPQAYGVVFKDGDGVMHYALLSGNGENEIILSAGAIGSPQTLMLSGIGPKQHLEAHGIELVLDSPMVGQGMADNPMNVVVIPSPEPVEESLVQVVGITNYSYIEAGSGLKLSFSLLQILQGLLNNSIASQIIKDLNIEFSASLKGGIIIEKVSTPLSTGHLELKSTDPDDNPFVTFNYFNDPQDLESCVEGMKIIIDVIKSKSFSRFRYPWVPVQALLGFVALLPVNLRPKHVTTAFSLKQYCFDTVLTIYHTRGGCQPGKVVDRDYKVMGVDALRVIDGSTFFSSPGTNPQATLMMLGRYMGQKILEERSAYKAYKVSSM